MEISHRCSNVDNPCINSNKGKTQARPSYVVTLQRNSWLVLAMIMFTLFSTIFIINVQYPFNIVLEDDNMEIHRVLMFFRILLPLHCKSSTNLHISKQHLGLLSKYFYIDASQLLILPTNFKPFKVWMVKFVQCTMQYTSFTNGAYNYTCYVITPILTPWNIVTLFMLQNTWACGPWLF
jgi:hypothetical protein